MKLATVLLVCTAFVFGCTAKADKMKNKGMVKSMKLHGESAAKELEFVNYDQSFRIHYDVAWAESQYMEIRISADSNLSEDDILIGNQNYMADKSTFRVCVIDITNQIRCGLEGGKLSKMGDITDILVSASNKPYLIVRPCLGIADLEQCEPFVKRINLQ